ncbi:MAG TPA: hypothetical protein PLG20_09905, partial [Candidatus Syntrophosphaera sp.]|nr:hypothetical protein [Candidatus Syntrophosphaera sp.]
HGYCTQHGNYFWHLAVPQKLRILEEAHYFLNRMAGAIFRYPGRAFGPAHRGAKVRQEQVTIPFTLKILKNFPAIGKK